jgi:hypothetical protein
MKTLTFDLEDGSILAVISQPDARCHSDDTFVMQCDELEEVIEHCTDQGDAVPLFAIDLDSGKTWTIDQLNGRVQEELDLIELRRIAERDD